MVDFHVITTEIFVNGAWLDISADILDGTAIEIVRGRDDEHGFVQVTTCNFTIRNDTGRFTVLNPESDLYRQFKQNTPVRLNVTFQGGTFRRFTGEVSALAQGWDANESPVYLHVAASGILRRLGQGDPPALSAPHRGLPGLAAAALAGYWPLADGALSAAVVDNPGSSTDPAIVTNGVGPNQGIPANTGLLAPHLPQGIDLSNGERLDCIMSGVFTTGGNPGAFDFAVNMGNDRGDNQPRWELFRATDRPRIGDFGAPGEQRIYDAWTMEVQPAGLVSTDEIVLSWVRDSSDPTLAQNVEFAVISVSGFFDGFVKWVRLQLESGPGPGEITWLLFINGRLRTSGVTGGFGGTPLDNPVVPITEKITFNRNKYGDHQTFVVGHPAVWSGPSTPSAMDTADIALGHVREPAAARIQRLCAEENIDFTLIGVAEESAIMGAQQTAPFLDLVRDCELADRGVLFEPVDVFGLGYRTNHSVYNQIPAVQFDYDGTEDESGDVFLIGQAINDDQTLVNKVTATRVDGGFATAELVEGSLSTQDPPDGVGEYGAEFELNVATDVQLPSIASWILHIGTLEAERYPTFQLHWTGNPRIVLESVPLDIRDRVLIMNMPDFTPPGSADLLIEGYEESIDLVNWQITYNCSPAASFNVAAVGERVDTTFSELVNAVGVADTEFDVITPQSGRGNAVWITNGGPEPTRPNDFPFMAQMGGEIVGVNTVEPAAWDEFARTEIEGWGNLPTGQTWEVHPAANAAFFSVSSSESHISIPDDTHLGTFFSSFITGESIEDPDICATVEVNQVPLTGSAIGSLIARVQDEDNYYSLEGRFSATGSAFRFAIVKHIAGARTTISSPAFIELSQSLVANQAWRMRFKIVGPWLFGKAWINTQEEPADWQIRIDDTDITAAGSIGCNGWLNASFTGLFPVVFSYDNFTSINPQTFTVTRSVNDVTKSHVAGESVRLAHPAIIAL